MDTPLRIPAAMNRRMFLKSAGGLGLAALAGTWGAPALASSTRPRARRIIYLFQSGAPSHLDLFDYKPDLARFRGQQLPPSIRNDQQLTAMTSAQPSLPVAPTRFQFRRYGQSGLELCELLPHVGEVADRLCVIRSMHTEAIDHDPALTLLQTGSLHAGRPSLGSWLAYGLGAPSVNLPAFVVLTSQGSGHRDDQPLYERLWGSGPLPAWLQGVRLSRASMRARPGELASRLGEHELTARLQVSASGLMDLSDEPASILEMYGPDVRRPGSYAYNCLVARRLAERGVRLTQLFHTGWDHHGGLPAALRDQCRDVDQPTAALVKDLAQRGLLEDTLVVWGGEFGRTVYAQGSLGAADYGRDHHPRCFTVWLAGAGIKPGLTYGQTDDYGYNIVEGPVSVRDLHATLFHLLGVDPAHLAYRLGDQELRLTEAGGQLVWPILA